MPCLGALCSRQKHRNDYFQKYNGVQIANRPQKSKSSADVIDFYPYPSKSASGSAAWAPPASPGGAGPLETLRPPKFSPRRSPDVAAAAVGAGGCEGGCLATEAAGLATTAGATVLGFEAEGGPGSLTPPGGGGSRPGVPPPAALGRALGRKLVVSSSSSSPPSRCFFV